MRCKCGSEHNVRLHFLDKKWYCQDCYAEIMKTLRELEDQNGQHPIETLKDSSNVPQVRAQ